MVEPNRLQTRIAARPLKMRQDITVGKILTQARLQRKEEFKDISRVLNIPSRHLQALEEGELSVFTAEIYARGAFTKYADYLGVANIPTQHAFMRALTGARQFIPLHVRSPRPWLATIISPRTVLATAILVIALLVGSYIAWQVQSFWRLPKLIIAQPVSNIASENNIVISGQAATDAKVTFNGQQILLTQDGSFESSLTLHPGINIVRLEATNAAGRTRTITRHILLPRN
jgi:hypothetical protein